jgi:hypothetical protein
MSDLLETEIRDPLAAYIRTFQEIRQSLVFASPVMEQWLLNSLPLRILGVAQHSIVEALIGIPSRCYPATATLRRARQSVGRHLYS